jgi:hypothetical protein
VVLPGEEAPGERDLLTEATLPVEQRPLQRRYTQISRFNVFLPPAGNYVLPGPDRSKLPNSVEGAYLILLRVEAADDKEGDADLAAVGDGPGVIHSGAIAGFPLPPLRYFVGSGTSSAAAGTLVLLSPAENIPLAPDIPIDFKWDGMARATLYRLELVGDDNVVILAALLQADTNVYRAPSWLRGEVKNGNLRWRVVAIDEQGRLISQSAWKSLRLSPAK